MHAWATAVARLRAGKGTLSTTSTPRAACTALSKPGLPASPPDPPGCPFLAESSGPEAWRPLVGVECLPHGAGLLGEQWAVARQLGGWGAGHFCPSSGHLPIPSSGITDPTPAPPHTRPTSGSGLSLSLVSFLARPARGTRALHGELGSRTPKPTFPWREPPTRPSGSLRTLLSSSGLFWTHIFFPISGIGRASLWFPGGRPSPPGAGGPPRTWLASFPPPGVSALLCPRRPGCWAISFSLICAPHVAHTLTPLPLRFRLSAPPPTWPLPCSDPQNIRSVCPPFVVSFMSFLAPPFAVGCVSPAFPSRVETPAHLLWGARPARLTGSLGSAPTRAMTRAFRRNPYSMGEKTEAQRSGLAR